MVRLFLLVAVLSAGSLAAAQELAVTKFEAKLTVHAYPRVIYNAIDKSTLGTCYNSPIRSDWTYCYDRAQLEGQSPQAAKDADVKKKSELVPVEIREVKPSKPQADASDAAKTEDYVNKVVINN